MEIAMDGIVESHMFDTPRLAATSSLWSLQKKFIGM
jgi:hypothetical protein